MLHELSQVLHFSMGYRYWWSPWVSSSLGLFTAYPFGVRKVYINEFGQAHPSSSLSENSVYGLDVALQFCFLKNNGSGPWFEIRHSMPFSPKAGEMFSHTSLFLGWNLVLQLGIGRNLQVH
jgi:hypothetical protein